VCLPKVLWNAGVLFVQVRFFSVVLLPTSRLDRATMNLRFGHRRLRVPGALFVPFTLSGAAFRAGGFTPSNLFDASEFTALALF
jgi:hypothetical protein